MGCALLDLHGRSRYHHTRGLQVRHIHPVYANMGSFAGSCFVDNNCCVDDRNAMDSLSIVHGYTKIHPYRHFNVGTALGNSFSMVKTGIWQNASCLWSRFMEQGFSHGDVYSQSSVSDARRTIWIPRDHFPVLGMVCPVYLVFDTSGHATRAHFLHSAIPFLAWCQSDQFSQKKNRAHHFTILQTRQPALTG